MVLGVGAFAGAGSARAALMEVDANATITRASSARRTSMVVLSARYVLALTSLLPSLAGRSGARLGQNARAATWEVDRVGAGQVALASNRSRKKLVILKGGGRIL